MGAEALAIASVFHALEGREIRQWSELSLRSLPECQCRFVHLPLKLKKKKNLTLIVKHNDFHIREHLTLVVIT